MGVAFEDAGREGWRRLGRLRIANVVDVRYALLDVVFDVDDAVLVVVEVTGVAGEGRWEMAVDGDLDGGDFSEGRIVDDDLRCGWDVLLDKEVVGGALAGWSGVGEGLEGGALLDQGIVLG